LQTNLGLQTEVGSDGPLLAARRFSPVVVIALIIGLLPLANGLLFRTYYFPLRPAGLNPLFELEFLYLFAEFCLILWARAQGMVFKAEFLKLNQLTRYALLAFLALFWISSVAFAPAPIYSAIRAFYWLVHIGCAFAVSYLIVTINRKLLQTAIVGASLAFVALYLFVMVHLYFSPVPMTERPQGYWGAIIPGFLSIRQFGMLAGFALTAWIALILIEKRPPLGRVMCLIVTTLIITAMLWSGTRSALLATGVALPFGLIFARKLPSLTGCAIVVLASAFGVYLSTFMVPVDGAFGMFATPRFAIGEGSDFASGRLDLWKFGAEMFLKSPLFGWGEGSFYQLFARANGDYHLQPHNFVIQFLMSWGILAGGIALIMMAKELLRLHLGLHRAYLMIIPLAALDSILVMAMLDGALFTLRTILPAIFFWILAEKISADADTAPA
jgi:exopolysaccharide production protein ExoQ